MNHVDFLFPQGISCPFTESLCCRTAGTWQRTALNKHSFLLPLKLFVFSEHQRAWPFWRCISTNGVFCETQHSYFFICQNNMIYAIELYARDSKESSYKRESPSCETGFNLVPGGNQTRFSAVVQTSQHLTGQQCCSWLLINIPVSSIWSFSVHNVRKLQKV